MIITNTYLGISRGKMSCLFFLLFEDYIDAQTQFANELSLELERFARNLGDDAAIVKPFTGDIDATRNEITDRNWTVKQREELSKTPALLMINVDFAQFDPQLHPWMLFNFGEKMTEGVGEAYRFRDTFAQLVEVIRETEGNIFEQAHAIKNQIDLKDAAKVFEAKPGIWGFSVDLKEGALLVSKLYGRLKKSPS